MFEDAIFWPAPDMTFTFPCKFLIKQNLSFITGIEQSKVLYLRAAAVHDTMKHKLPLLRSRPGGVHPVNICQPDHHFEI